MNKKKTANSWATLQKPYNIADLGGSKAEINLYGEVVDDRPVDWRTGQPVQGSYIVVSEFLKDLEDLGDKEQITVHINSVGGSLYGGIAIYNRLKSLSAQITTINDGLAASAGSIIFQAGNTRKVNAGSNVMVHGALGILWGHYDVKGLRDVIKQLEAGTKAAVNIYAQTTGRDRESICALVEQETWMTGQEAVDQGFADEVMEDGAPVTMSLTADKKYLLVNGVSMPTFCLPNLPQNIPVQHARPEENPLFAPGAFPAASIKNNVTGGAETMEITTIDQLRDAFPELTEQMEAAARAAGALEERSRLQSIENIQRAIGDPDLIAAAKYGETPLTAEQLALKAMQAQAQLGNAMLGAMAADAKASNAAWIGAAPNPGTEPTPEEEEKAQEARAIQMIVGPRGRKEGK